jgi:hypothetical protein
MIYLDNGPIARSHVFQQVTRYLDIDVRAHLPQGKDGPFDGAKEHRFGSLCYIVFLTVKRSLGAMLGAMPCTRSDDATV